MQGFLKANTFKSELNLMIGPMIKGTMALLQRCS